MPSLTSRLGTENPACAEVCDRRTTCLKCRAPQTEHGLAGSEGRERRCESRVEICLEIVAAVENELEFAKHVQLHDRIVSMRVGYACRSENATTELLTCIRYGCGKRFLVVVTHRKKRPCHTQFRHLGSMQDKLSSSVPVRENTCTLNLEGGEVHLPGRMHSQHTTDVRSKCVIVSEIAEAAKQTHMQSHVIGPLLQLDFPAALSIRPAASAFMFTDLVLERRSEDHGGNTFHAIRVIQACVNFVHCLIVRLECFRWLGAHSTYAVLKMEQSASIGVTL